MLKRNQRGFTLIELLLVVVIIGVMLAVIVPRAWRANVDAKYGLVRQNATELASFASQWAEQMMEAQDMASTSKLVAYYNSLARSGFAAADNGGHAGEGGWIANTTQSNWAIGADTGVNINGRLIGGADALQAEARVEGVMPPERIPRNPFSGANVFADFPATTPLPGALAAGRAIDASQGAGQQWSYYALIFQGTDSTTIDAQVATSYHAGMGVTLAGLRNGVFMARLQYD